MNQLLQSLLEEVREHDLWRRLGHRPRCILYAGEPSAHIIEARLDGRALMPEQRRVWDYLRRCPICREAIRETVRDLSGADGGSRTLTPCDTGF